jgi:UTP-glucose-1-phosphate uridylyltransferase
MDKLYLVEETVSGTNHKIKATSAITALIKYLEVDKNLFEGKRDVVGDEFSWDFTITRIGRASRE